MKKLVNVLSILLLLSCQQNTEYSKFKTVMLKSQGEVETLPDMATFQINLSCLKWSIKESKNCIVDKSNELHAALQSFGIKESDILTTSVNMNKSYVWQNSKRVFKGYDSSTSLYVTVRDIDKLGEIYTELLDNSELTLGGLSYSHSQLDSLENAAYVAALENSKVLTDKLLERLPESKKEILKIGNVEISASLPEAAGEKKYILKEELEYASNVARDKSVAISQGTVKVLATLYVEYQIK